jgi:hypothetical protein
MAAQPIPPVEENRPELRLVEATQTQAVKPKSSFRPYFWWLLVFVTAVVLAWLMAAPRIRAEQQTPAAYSSGSVSDVRGLMRI